MHQMFVKSNPTYHRIIAAHNKGEYEKVKESMELWGSEARTLAGGICVQAFPGRNSSASGYSFQTHALPRKKYGFVDGIPVVREVQWAIGMEGVEERRGGQFAAIRLSWLEGKSNDRS